MSNITNYIAQARATRIAARAAGEQPSSDASIIDKAAGLGAKAVAKAESLAVETASNYLDMRMQMKAERIARGCRW